jgi:putative transposase
MALSVSYCVSTEVPVSTKRVGFEVQEDYPDIFSERLGCEIVELNVQADHVHLLVEVPPKISISKLMGTVKRKAAIQIFHQFPSLIKKPCLGERLLY